MGKPLVSLTDICQPCVIQEDFLKNKGSNLECEKSRKESIWTTYLTWKGAAFVLCSFQGGPRAERPFSRQQMLYQWKFKAKRKCGTLHNAWHLWLKKWTQSSLYKMTGWRLHKTATTAGPLRTASGLRPHYTSHRARSRGRICRLALPSRWKAGFSFHLEHYWFVTRHMTFWKNLSQPCQQASPETCTQNKTYGQPTWVIGPVWPQIWAHGGKRPLIRGDNKLARCGERSHNHH